MHLYSVRVRHKHDLLVAAVASLDFPMNIHKVLEGVDSTDRFSNPLQEKKGRKGEKKRFAPRRLPNHHNGVIRRDICRNRGQPARSRARRAASVSDKYMQQERYERTMRPLCVIQWPCQALHGFHDKNHTRRPRQSFVFSFFYLPCLVGLPRLCCGNACAANGRLRQPRRRTPPSTRRSTQKYTV